MIEVATNMIVQCFGLVIPIILIMIIFEFLGAFFFGKR